MEQTLTNSLDLPLGQLLKNTRETQGFTLDAVAQKLYINKRQLEKLENDQEVLICDVYTLGFLRSYAQFLNLNASSLIQQFKDKTNHLPPPQLAFPSPLPERGRPSFRVLYLSLFALVALIIGYEWFGKQNDTSSPQKDSVLSEAPLKKEPETIDASPPQALTAVSPLEETPPSIDSSPPQEPLLPAPSATPFPDSSTAEISSSAPHVALLKATEETWIEVKNEKGEIIVSRLFHPNETFEFKDPQNLILKTGNASGILLTSGEKTLSFPEKKGEVLNNITLNPIKWENSVSPKESSE